MRRLLLLLALAACPLAVSARAASPPRPVSDTDPNHAQDTQRSVKPPASTHGCALSDTHVQSGRAWCPTPEASTPEASEPRARAAAPAAALGRFLIAYTSCDSTALSCRQQLAQSRDGVRWSAVPGFVPQPGTHPVAVRRGARLYLFDGPALRRFAVSGPGLTELPRATVQLDSGEALAGENAFLDTGGTLVLVYAVPATDGSSVTIKTAMEVPGSDGQSFAADPGQRVTLGAGAAAPALAPSRGGWVGLVAQGTCLQLLTAANAHGAYRPAAGLPGGCISGSTPLASPSAAFRPLLGEYWLYAVAGGQVVRAVTRGLGRQLAARRFRPLRLPGSPTVASASFAPASPR
jgi:hypothetical protein